MRVPINPQTNVPTGQLGYEKAVDVTAGARALAQVVDKYAEVAAQDEKKRELFDVQKLLVDETNNIQTDFDAKKTVEPLGAPNFVQRVNGEYNTRHAQMVQGLKDRGYSDDAVNEFATRLGTIRSQYVAQAIDFQDKSSYAKTAVDTKNTAVSLGHYVGKNPGAVPSALDEFRVLLSNSGLDKIKQAAQFEQGKEIILSEARSGFALQHPEIVLGLYSPNELTTTSPTNLPAGQQFDLHSYIGKLAPAEGTARNPRSSAVGFGQFLDGTWLQTYKEVFGNTKETKEQILAKKKDKAVALKLTERFTNDNVQRLIAAKAPVNDATVYLSHFLGVDGALKVISAHADETIGKLVRSDAINANPGVFKKVQTAGDLISWARGKMNVEPAQAIKPIPVNWRGNQEDAIRELGMTADQAAQYLKTGKDLRTAPVTQAVISPYQLDENGQTGIAVLDLASGPERLQMLTQARTIMNERENDAKAAQREAHNTWFNDLLNQLQDGKLGQADLDTAYQNGQITDFDERAKAQAIIDSKNKKDDDIVLFGSILNSGVKGNPYSNEQQKAVDAGFEAGIKDIVKNKKDISPFDYALHLWERTGIMPKQGAVMIRGGLVGTDPQQVAGAASVANNMIRQNPNAFAGVEGQAEIEHAAVAYGHYIYDLGMSPQDASMKVAQENDPKFKEKFKYNDPATQEILKTLRQNGVDATRSFKGAKFPNQDALNEGNQTYYELLRDQLNRGLEFGAATAQVNAQMQKIYGVNSTGRVVKYSPERAYPTVNGSWDYIYKDAQKTVKDETGRDPIHVNLVPIPGVTDEDFRQGRQARYRIIYNYKAGDGQTVVDSVPGEFAADVTTANKEAGEKNRKEFVKAREAEINTQTEKKRQGSALYIVPGLSPVR